MPRSELDHIVVAAARLEHGVEWIAQRLGVEPQPGGKHVAMGTHNALLKLGPRAYLEVIAIDPDAAAPARPRWFSLDEPAMQSRLAAGPALITWVLRCDSLAAACARAPDLGEILSMNRGDFHWKIAVAETGTLPWSGVLPAAIQWESGADGAPMHPCDRLPDSGCELLELRLAHPAAMLGTAGLVALFRELRVLGPVNLKSGPVHIEARLGTPNGEVSLS
jgi:hypothetical protein